jgi:hypothetical protein
MKSTNRNLKIRAPNREVKTNDRNQKQATNMETHAHHLHKGPSHGWKHYVYEFFMLFLAVFCGFLAEYQLEHIIEKDRGKQYMRLMIEDLKVDQLMLESNISQRLQRIAMIDSLVYLLNLPQRNEHGNELYFLARRISPPINIFPNDGAIQQLKSAGNLRLIHQRQISNSIMAYDQKMRQSLFLNDDDVQIRTEYRRLAIKVFNSTVFNEMVQLDSTLKPTNNPKLFSEDAELINELIGAAQYIKRANQGRTITTRQLLEQAKKLSDDIKKEYHLE